MSWLRRDGRRTACEEVVDQVEDVQHVDVPVAVRVGDPRRPRTAREKRIDQGEDVVHVQLSVAVHVAGTDRVVAECERECACCQRAAREFRRIGWAACERLSNDARGQRAEWKPKSRRRPC